MRFTKDSQRIAAPKAMPISQALQVFGLSSGQNLSTEELKSKYRKLALETHPDRPSGDRQKFSDVANAFEVLINYAGRPFPSEDRQTSYGESYSHSPREERSYGEPEGPPESAKKYTEQDLNAFLQDLVDMGWRKVIIREYHNSSGWFNAGLDGGPSGSQIAQKTIKPSDLSVESLKAILNGLEIYSSVDNIWYMDKNENWKEAWINFGTTRPKRYPYDAGYSFQTVSFKPPPKAYKKTKGALSKTEVVVYLKSKGLQRMEGGHRNQYYGIPGSTSRVYIRLKERELTLVKREKGSRDLIISDRVPYGKATKELLDRAVAALEKRG